jgi:hypothetical protein
MTASTSTTFTAEATPAPSASTAFATSLRASRSSRLSAFAQMLLVIRWRSRFFMIFNSSVSAPFGVTPACPALERATAGVRLQAAEPAAEAAGPVAHPLGGDTRAGDGFCLVSRPVRWVATRAAAVCRAGGPRRPDDDVRDP